MDHLLRDLRYATRSLLRRPAFLIVATATLALGIGATTAIFSVVHGVLLRSLPYPDSDRIVVIWEADRREPGSLGGQMSHPNFVDYRAQSRTVESMAQLRGANLTVTGLGDAMLVRGGNVTPDFFRVLGVDLVMGRSFTPEENLPGGPRAVVVGEGFWREHLAGVPDVLGTLLQVNGEAHTIVGVAPADLQFPADARLWTPARNDDAGCGRGCVLYATIGRLGPGVTLERSESELATIADRLEEEYPVENVQTTAGVARLQDVQVGEVQTALLLLMGAVVMVLLIACANVANLMLVRGGSRATELAVRAALGAGRPRLLSQLMTESLVLGLAGGAGGVLLAAWGVRALRGLAPPGIPRLDEIAVSGPTLGFAVAIAIVTSLLFGLAPALQLSRIPLGSSLREGRGRVGGRRIGRSAIVAAELALSVMLLLGAGLMLRSLLRLNAVDLGFDPAGVVTFRLSLPDARYPTPDDAVVFMGQLEQRLASMPGIERVAVAVAPPFGTAVLASSLDRTDQPPRPPGEGMSYYWRAIGPGFLELMNIPLVSGRDFEEADRAGSIPVALITRRAAEAYFPGEDPVGKQVELDLSTGYPEDAPRTIVGVVENVRMDLSPEAPYEELWIPYAQAGASFPNVLLESRRPAGEELADARRELASLDPLLPMAQPGAVLESVDAAKAPTRFYVLLLTLFAVLAVLLAAVGIYGVVAYLVLQRTREIGVRMALGARVREVVQLVVWQGLRPAIVGLLAGLGIAVAAGRILRSVSADEGLTGILRDVTTRDPLIFAAATALLLGIVVVACLVPARRAAGIAPSSALRNE